MQWMQLIVIFYRMAVKRLGMLGVRVRWMKVCIDYEDGDIDIDW
jgi:hypothetical protein